jgi:hypothetical protein
MIKNGKSIGTREGGNRKSVGVHEEGNKKRCTFSNWYWKPYIFTPAFKFKIFNLIYLTKVISELPPRPVSLKPEANFY